jgi:hypothetical protein
MHEPLTDVRRFIGRFCAFPNEHCLNAVTLWAAHCHVVEHFHTTPRLAVLSPEPESGKSRVLEILETLTPEPMLCLSPSPATVFRTLSDRQITLLMDEVDTVWQTKGKDDTHEDLRGLLNAGYRRGATIPRCVGPRHEVVNFNVFCAVALAGIGDLPDTIMTRSIIIRMRRRAPHEHVEPFRIRVDAPIGEELRDSLAEWAESVGPSVGEAWPDLPDGITDRRAECWEPLIAIADAAGGEWPEIARAACLNLANQSRDKVSLGVRLLSDLRTIFGDADALHTETIIDRLCEGEQYGIGADAPWSELHGKRLGKRGLATMLRRYNVTPIKVTVGGKSLQGYRREHLWDAWARYLPPDSGLPELPELSEPKAAAPVPAIPEVPAIRLPEGASDLIDAAREGTDLTRDQARDLLAADLDDLLAGTLTVAAARHYLEHNQ